MAWEEAKSMTIVEFLKENGAREWKKGEHERYYMNDFKVFADAVGYEYDNRHLFRKVNCYYDAKNDSFSYNSNNSTMSDVKTVLKAIRKVCA